MSGLWDVFFAIPNMIVVLLYTFIKEHILLTAVFVLIIAGLKWRRNIKFTKRNIIILSSVAVISLIVFIAYYTNPFNRLMRDLKGKHSVYKIETEYQKSENRLVFHMFIKGMNVGPGGNESREELEVLRQIQNEFIAGINQKEVSEYLKKKYSIFNSDDVSIQLGFANQTGMFNLMTWYYGGIRSENYNGSDWFSDENKKVQTWSYYGIAESGEYNMKPTYISYTEILEELEKQEIDNKQPNDK